MTVPADTLHTLTIEALAQKKKLRIRFDIFDDGNLPRISSENDGQRIDSSTSNGLYLHRGSTICEIAIVVA